MSTDPFPEANLSNWRQHPFSRWGFTHVDRLVPVARIAAGTPSPLPQGPAFDLGTLHHTWNGARVSAQETLAATHTDGLLVLKQGAVVASHLAGFQQLSTPHIVFSVSKSITACLAGILVEQGLLDPQEPVTHYVPEAKASAYGDCTLRHVLDMTVSIRFTEDYLDPLGDVARYRVAMGWNPPGAIADDKGLHAFIATLPKGEDPHGERFHYVSPNSDMLGWIIERASGSTVADLLTRHVWQPMGMADEASITVDRLGAPRTAGGISTSLADLARFGEMMRGRGSYLGRRIVPESWVEDILHKGDPEAWAKGDLAALFPEGRYRSKWYIADPSSNVLCAIGIHGQWIYVDHAAGLVAVKHSSQPIPADDEADHRTLSLFRALATALA